MAIGNAQVNRLMDGWLGEQGRLVRPPERVFVYCSGFAALVANKFVDRELGLDEVR